jgi:hypothetical protein
MRSAKAAAFLLMCNLIVRDGHYPSLRQRTLDGLDDNDRLKGYAFEGAMRARPDSLQEFRVTTSNYDCGVRMLGYNTQLSTPRVMQCSLRFAF